MEITLSSALFLANSACDGIVLACVQGKETELDSIYATLDSIQEVIEKFKSIEQDEETLKAIHILNNSYERALDAVNQEFGKRIALN